MLATVTRIHPESTARNRVRDAYRSTVRKCGATPAARAALVWLHDKGGKPSPDVIAGLHELAAQSARMSQELTWLAQIDWSAIEG